MAQIKIEDGFLNCPKFGIMDEIRCVKSCNFFVSKDENFTECKFGEEETEEMTEAEETTEKKKEKETK